MKVGDLVRCDCEFKRDGVVPLFGVIIDQLCHSWGTEFLVLIADSCIEQTGWFPIVDRYWFCENDLELIETGT